MRKLKKMKLKKTKLVGREFWYREDDRYIGQRIALEKYEPYLTKLILENTDDNSIAVDVGANIGYYTVILAEKVKKVWAVEPEEKTFEILQKNIEGLENVTTSNVAVGSRNGEAELVRSEENYGDHKIISNLKFKISKIQKVKVKRLDDLIKEKPRQKLMHLGGQVDLMKIDVQGFESEVILGAKKIIEKYRPTIFFELSKKESYEKDKKIFLFLEKIYKNIYFIDEYIQTYYPVSFEWVKKYVGKKEQCNLAVFRKNDLKIRWEGVKDFWVKKWVKRKLGKLET